MVECLCVTSNKIFFCDMVNEFTLSQITDDFYKGKTFDLLLVKDNKIESAITLTHLLDSMKAPYKRVIIINPINSPSININTGEFVFAENITEWDKPITESKFFNLEVPKIDRFNVHSGSGISGDRLCVSKTTPILQKAFVDFITFPISLVLSIFSKETVLISLGIVVDHCSLNYLKQLQSNNKELSSRMIDFLKSNLSVLIGE